MSTQSLPHVNIYTDGACSPNPGLGGWAAIITATVAGESIEKLLSGAVEDVNNQRMELMAVVEALESLKRPCEVDLYADSQYVVKGMGEWLANWIASNWLTSKRTAVKHADLWKRIVAQTEIHQVRFHWIKAHGVDAMNDRVDALVHAARLAYKDEAESTDDATAETVSAYRLLIAGSRHASDNMLEYARRVVHRAIEQSWQIVVGDNPDGVDAEVVAECNRRKYEHVIVVGIANQPRNGGVNGAQYVQSGTSYSQRDRNMALASDRGIFIWDGASSGTHKGCKYMHSLGKQVDLMNFQQTFA